MRDMNKLEELIYKEIDKEVTKGSLNPESMKAIGDGIDVIKDILEMEKCEMEIEQGYSGHFPQRGYNIMPYMYGSYEGGGGSNESYARGGGGSYARRRDSMGRFSREGGGSYENSYRRGGGGGYSRDEKIDSLQRMMDEASDPDEREAYRRLIVKMENEKK